MRIMKVRVLDGQTFFDLAVRHAGDVAAAYQIALLAGRSVTDTPPAEVEIPTVINPTVVAYFASESIEPATMMTDEEIDSKLL